MRDNSLKGLILESFRIDKDILPLVTLESFSLEKELTNCNYDIQKLQDRIDLLKTFSLEEKRSFLKEQYEGSPSQRLFLMFKNEEERIKNQISIINNNPFLKEVKISKNSNLQELLLEKLETRLYSIEQELPSYEPADYDQFSDEIISKQVEEVVAGYDYRIKSLEDYKDRLIRDYKCFSDFVSKYREQLESL